MDRKYVNILHVYGQAVLAMYYNMTVCVLAGYGSHCSIVAGLIRLHIPGVK